MQKKYKAIDISKSIKNPLVKALYSCIKIPFESFFAINKVNQTYTDVLNNDSDASFIDKCLLSLQAVFEISEEDIKKIPLEGPLIVVSNHPYGGIDGMILGSILDRVRGNTKLLANGLLATMPEMKKHIIEVNPFGTKAATMANVGAMKETLKFLKSGGCLATFPSGTVSHLHLKQMNVTDPEWNTNVAQLAKRTGATVLPVFFEGRNSNSFQLTGLLHPLVRTALLARELFKRTKKGVIKLRVGKPVSPKKLSDFETDKELTSWLRLNTYMLSKRQDTLEHQFYFDFGSIKNNIRRLLPKRTHILQDIIQPINPDDIAEEIVALPEENCLIKGEKVSVYYAYSWQIKRMMFEIGRLREETFRSVGEGTGKSFDIDEFDSYYLHLFMWDAANKKIVGAYRVGHTDRIKKSIGIQGLYTTTLFKIKPELLDRIDPALEMGRSFIVAEYQKKRSTLALLWRGIGEYISRNPQYKTLFGPVSIDPRYNLISKDLIVQFLSKHKTSKELAPYVRAKKPPKAILKASDKDALISTTKDVDYISALISEIESDNKGIPTLLKHYLKLNGEILSFNVDSAFGNCLDGLIMVDLLKTDERLLKVYMGEEQTIKYRKYHGL